MALSTYLIKASQYYGNWTTFSPNLYLFVAPSYVAFITLITVIKYKAWRWMTSVIVTILNCELFFKAQSTHHIRYTVKVKMHKRI